MSRDKKKSEPESNADWMTTYGDMMTLLLAFFFLLYSFSSIDNQKFAMVIEGLQGKLGVLEGGKTISSSKMINAGLNSKRTGLRRIGELYERVSRYIRQENLQKDVKLEITDRGLTIRFTGKVLFPLGKAEIKDQAYNILDKMAQFVKSVPNDVVVEGHTDNLPIQNSNFPSNWELSTTRATNVIRYFIENNSINPVRLSAAGYSKYKPVKPNNSVKNRSLNRRVDIIILKMDETEEDITNE